MAPPPHLLYPVLRYSGLGCLLAGAVLLFLAGGWAVDRWLGTTPGFTIAGALVGAVLGTVSVYRQLQAGIAEERRERREEGR